jgi:hypothetical protein
LFPPLEIIIRPMPKTIPALAALALGGACLLASPAHADDADRALLVVNYESGCEAHATDNGGAVVFEQHVARMSGAICGAGAGLLLRAQRRQKSRSPGSITYKP